MRATGTFLSGRPGGGGAWKDQLLGGAWVWHGQEGLSGGGAGGYTVPEARRGAEQIALSPGLSLGWWGASAGVQEPLWGTSHLMRTHSWVSLRTWKKWVSGKGGASVGRALRLQETLCSPPGVNCLVHEHECEHVHACT